MTELYFVDTNVLVYERDTSEPVKQEQAEQWLRHLWRNRTGRLSYQILCELYTTTTVKLRPGLTHEEAQELVRQLATWRPVAVDLSVLQSGWLLQARHSLSFWDALIVAAADSARCAYLLTEDLSDQALYGNVTVINPFAHAPPP